MPVEVAGQPMGTALDRIDRNQTGGAPGVRFKFVLFQFLNVFNARAEEGSAFNPRVFGNP